MLKKYMIFGSVVLIVAALFALTGCTQATSGESGSRTYAENYLYGTSDEADVKAAVTAAKAGNRVVVLTKDLRLTRTSTSPVAVADFETLTIRIEGRVAVTGMIINAAFANLVFDEGASIALDDDSVFIYDGEPDDKNITGGSKVKYVRNPLQGTQGTDQGIAVLDYEIKGNFSDIHTDVTDLYVLNTLTVNAGSVAPGANNPKIIPLGTVELTASNAVVFANLTNFVFTTSSTLKSTGPGATITLATNATPGFPTIEAAGGPIIITSSGALGAVTIADVKGPETVTLSPTLGVLTVTKVSDTGKLRIAEAAIPSSAAVTVADNAGLVEFDATGAFGSAVTITKNTGDVVFKNTVSLGANQLIAPDNNGNILFQSPVTTTGVLGDTVGTAPGNRIAGGGAITFENTATLGGAAVLDTNIVFNGNVTTGTALTLGGDVTLANDKTITLSAVAAEVTLKAGKTIFVGPEAVLAGGATGALITPGTGAVLTAGRAFDEDTDDEETLVHKTLTLGTAGVTVTSGELRVLGTGVLETDAQAVTVEGALTLEAGGILLLTNASSSVVIGTDITIAGAATSTKTLAALDGEVRLTPGTITGRGSTLQVPEDNDGPTITVGTTSAVKTLTLAGANLDLQYGGGMLVLPYGGNKVILEGGTYPGKLTLSDEITPYSGTLGGKALNDGNYKAALTGSGALLGSDATDLPNTIGQLSGAQTGLTITGLAAANSVTIGNGATVDTP